MGHYMGEVILYYGTINNHKESHHGISSEI